jgi:hypothetical protein
MKKDWVVAQEDFGGDEAADCDVSAADGVKKGGVGRGAERSRDVHGERRVFEIRNEGGTMGLMDRAEVSGEGEGRVCEVSGG